MECPINGWLVVDKPKGVTSAGFLRKVKGIVNPKKVGHGGTLDPLATGVLPLAFGEATKTLDYVLHHIKEYNFTVKWGESRDTDDADGKVTFSSDKRPNEEEIRRALPQFLGEINQVPPHYSAIKIKGRRAYDLARANEKFSLSERKISILSFKLSKILDQNHASFCVVCGKGAYMRSLARDLALFLGTRGHITSLRRTRLGPFGEEEAISLDKLMELVHTAPVKDFIKPVEAGLDDIPVLVLTDEESSRIKNGQRLSKIDLTGIDSFEGLDQSGPILVLNNEGPVALARYEEGEIRPFRVFNL